MDQAPDIALDAVAHGIWDMKYRLKAADGTPIDATPGDTWWRVAKAVAAAEPEAQREHWAKAFNGILSGYRYLPAGRILAGAGTERAVTLFNCFVMGAIPDSLPGIFDGLKEAALTMQQGGGIGHDFSTLRPRGAPVKGVGADASGPLSFMDVWDSMCRTIMSAGTRRGAMMATLRCDHPDIESFVAAKRDASRLRNFNLSVLITDAFMTAVKNGSDWPLVFEGKTLRVLKARALWDQIMSATYDYAEPGVVFIDRVNAENNLNYCETISSTNPCITADTWIATSEGPRQVHELTGKAFEALVSGGAWPSDDRGFFSSGVKPTVEVATREGYRLRLTHGHRLRRAAADGSWDWIEAERLQPGDSILIHNHRKNSEWGAAERRLDDEAEGYLLGLLIGDGVLKKDKAVLSVWPGLRAVNGAEERPGVRGVMAAVLEASSRLPHRSDFSGWMEVAGRGEYRLALGAVKRLALKHAMEPGRKAITPVMERRSSAFHLGCLRGLFDSDGSVQGSQRKGVSVRLAQSDVEMLRAVQRMLLRLGIASSIYAERRVAGWRMLPDGKGGSKSYAIRAQHELVIANDNLAIFASRIGFNDTDKQQNLTIALANYKRIMNQEAFRATVKTVSPAGEAEVFDASIPGIHAFDANGLWAHNCGEQPLPPYGACLLGSMNLTRFVKNPFTDEAQVDEDELDEMTATAIRFMDNVIDVSNYPLEAQRREAKAKRRIGLGVTGLADTLAMCGLVYGTEAAAELAARWMARIEAAAYGASIGLAKERGAFPLFDRDRYGSSGHASRLPEKLREAIRRQGIRNGLVTSIAPTGTISLFAGNVSSGIEPIFSIAYDRKIMEADGSRRTERVTDYAANLWWELKGKDTPLPPAFVTAETLTPEAHLIMQAAVQRHVDSSISKTINVPASLAFEDFKKVYERAYDLGLKGCTTFRPNEVTGSVLSVEALPKSGEVVYMKQPLERREVLPGFTYKLKWPETDHAIYITVNDIFEGGRRRPFEIFINSKNMEHYAWTVALTRMISAVFRRGGDVTFVVEELKAVFDPRGGQWMAGRYVPSLLAAIGGIIEKHMIETGFLKVEDQTSGLGLQIAVGEQRRSSCPRCGEQALVFQEGCATCLSCGFSKCS